MGGAQRRIVLVTLGTLISCLLLVGALLYQHRQLQQQLSQQRDRAVRAVEQGHYTDARGVLEAYLHHNGFDDAEAMASLARAIIAETAPTRSERVHAMRLFHRVARLEPENISARLQLLALQRELGFDESLVRTADEILTLTGERDADQVRYVQRLKVEALLRLERYSAALTAAAAMTHSDPQAIEPHHLVLQVVAAGPWPAREVIAYARELHEQHRDDVRFEVLLGAAHRLVGRGPEATAVLGRCVDRPMPDVTTAHLLVNELEAVNRFDKALAVLEQGVARFDDANLETALVTRLWQRGRDHAVLDHFSGRLVSTSALAVDDPDGELLANELVAIKIMALLRRDRRGDAEPWLDVLRQRSTRDAAAGAWVIYLTGVFDQPISPALVIQRCQRALLRDPDNAYIRFELGNALASQGEDRAAIAQWRLAAEASPAWAAPRLHGARALIRLELATQAVEWAQAAHRRSGPGNVATRVALAESRRLRMDRGGGDSPAALLEWVEAIQRDRPHEPRTLALYIDLLAKVGRREDASETLLAALDRSLPEATLLALAQISRTHSLGLAEACYAQCEALHGRTPALAYARAMDDWKRGRAERALAGIRPPRDLSPNSTAAQTWELARVRFYDETDAPEMSALWERLLQRYPDSLAVQRAALRSAVVRADRQLTRQVIHRLRELTGEDAMDWRLAEAQWLLDDADVSAEQAARAALLLGPVQRAVPELIESRLTLAQAFLQMNEPDVAVAQLRAASEFAPHHQPVLLKLSRLLMEQGEPSAALAMLNRVVENPTSTVPQLQQAAAMLVRLRGWDEAVAALTRAAAAGGRTPSDLLRLGLAEEEARGAEAERSDRD